MLPEWLVQTMLQEAEKSLRGWQEPSGFLVATEPDADERARIREGLIGYVTALRGVLQLTEVTIGGGVLDANKIRRDARTPISALDAAREGEK